MLLRADFENINKSNNIPLKELSDVKIDKNAPVEERLELCHKALKIRHERLELFLQQIGNPYHFLVNGIPVEISFSNHNKTLDSCLYNYLLNKKQSDSVE